MLGKTRSQLSGSGDDAGESSVAGSILKRAKQLSSKKMTNYVSGKIGDVLGLDRLSVEGDLLGANGEEGATLFASKRISDRTEITYSTGIGHINEKRIRLEYRLTGRLSVQGETDQAGRSGLDFKYRLRYR
jgi:autotransporter translocation and assembly factor TamB